MKTKILFLIPNLMHGGAEKVLVNLVNNLNKEKYDVTLQTIFDVGINKKYLSKDIKYKYIFKTLFRGSSIIFKIFTPEFLYNHMIKDDYDIIVSYLEGLTARIISGCNNKKTKKVSWIHIELNNSKEFKNGFRSNREAIEVYKSFDKIICVSGSVKDAFIKHIDINDGKIEVIYNVNETDQIIEKSSEEVDDIQFRKDKINICSVGKIVETKGYDRLARVHNRLLKEGINHNVYILGIGEYEKKLLKYINDNNLQESFKLVGFRDNPYKYVKQCDLFVCSSLREGLSTSVTESLLVGTPVMSTLCSGAYELLGCNNEYGVVVENSEEGIYRGLKDLLKDREKLLRYRQKTIERSKLFIKSEIINKTEYMIDNL